MTLALSYASGASDKPLLGSTIGVKAGFRLRFSIMRLSIILTERRLFPFISKSGLLTGNSRNGWIS